MKIICDWQNCKDIGVYKAPVERDNSKKYRLLCLKHIKIFNKNWNYFENMNDQEIEYFIKSDLTWHKSTKKFGSSENFFSILWNNALEDKLNIFESSNYRKINELLPYLLNDKKNDNDKINFILLKKIGKTTLPNKFKMSLKKVKGLSKAIAQY